VFTLASALLGFTSNNSHLLLACCRRVLLPAAGALFGADNDQLAEPTSHR
jgi:hypothetical protein